MRGDTLAVARAWERSRVEGLAPTAAEAAQARAAVGRAIRDARVRRALGHEPRRAEDDVLPVMPRRSTARWVVAGGAVLVALIAVLLLRAPSANGGGGTPVARPAASAPITGARGRTSATLAPVAEATPPPTVAPTPLATSLPEASGNANAPSVGGPTPGGATSVGGIGSGTGSGASTPAPSPSPLPSPSSSVNALPSLPPRLAPGQDRFVFRVLDAATGMPLANVCVDYATLACGPDKPHTGPLGYYWLDMPPSAAPNWTFRFYLEPDYVPATMNTRYVTGMGDRLTTVLLRHR